MLVPLLEPVGEGIWTLDGPAVRAYGFPFPTRMVVVRLSGGGLWLWSPIALDGAVLVIAHGACSMANGTEVLRRSCRWLLQ
jgi:hypothetical protein